MTSLTVTQGLKTEKLEQLPVLFMKSVTLFGELINELWTPKFNKREKIDPEIELLESSASQDEFFEELCKNAPPEELWGILNRVKNSKNKELNRDVVNGAKTQFVKNKQ